MPAVLRPDAQVYALAVPHLQIRALACPAALLMFVAVGAFRGFKDTTYVSLGNASGPHSGLFIGDRNQLLGYMCCRSCV